MLPSPPGPSPALARSGKGFSLTSMAFSLYFSSHAPHLPSLSSSSPKFIPSKLLFAGFSGSCCVCRRRNLPTAATLNGDAWTSGEEAAGTGQRKVLLEVKDLRAVVAESRLEILHGVNLTIKEGEVHAIMGKNGSGKSTLSKVLVGHPDYEVTGGTVSFKGENLLDMKPEERSHVGIFMSFQTPVEIPGVSNMDFLHMAYNARRKKRGEPELSPIEFFGFLSPKLAAVNMSPKFLDRNVNEGFSGGEKKRNEILQLAVLEAELAILDEIDSGLDVDALQDVSKAINGLLTPHNSVLIITHYQRLLECIKPTFVHIMEKGNVVRTGDISLAQLLEREGYRSISAV